MQARAGGRAWAGLWQQEGHAPILAYLRSVSLANKTCLPVGRSAMGLMQPVSGHGGASP